VEKDPVDRPPTQSGRAGRELSMVWMVLLGIAGMGYAAEQ
jgi:hypothetical protein